MRDALTKELAQCRDGILSTGERKIGEPMTQHIRDLQRIINQLSRLIAVCSPYDY